MERSILPKSAEEARLALGPGFVRDFSARLEKICVDVVRLEGLSTAYSFSVGPRSVIAVPTNGNWFYNNWNIAHELGHLCLGHEGVLPGNSELSSSEQQANNFAAELLLPESVVRSMPWEAISLAQVADFVWESGVSTAALKNRLDSLGIGLRDEVAAALTGITQRLLRKHWVGESGEVGEAGETGDPITARMSQSATRRFPDWLKSAHLRKIEQRELSKGTLAWMLGVDPEDIEVEAIPEWEVPGFDDDPLEEFFA